MKIVFVSNYINHHQIPFCNAMYQRLNGEFYFLQTEPMEEERVRMGWKQETELPYLKLQYEEPELCRQLLLDCDVVLFGGCEQESLIQERLEQKKPVVRMSERLYKSGQWKAISPRGLRRKYLDHTRYRKEQVYLLCCGGYVASDFHMVRAYPGKMYRWGYFPAVKEYDIDKLLESKAGNRGEIPRILWAGRFIWWKNPQVPILVADYLRKKGIAFQLEMIGGGELEKTIRELIVKTGLEDCVTLSGYLKPEEVRSRMEQADVYLLTSNREEGWGAVVNEAMNSGCAVAANHMAGAVPYLIQHGENGFIYEDEKTQQLCEMVERLLEDNRLRRGMARKAYETITREWNAEHAADCLLELLEELGLVPEGESGRFQGKQRTQNGPCSPAPVVKERRIYKQLTKGKMQ